MKKWNVHEWMLEKKVLIVSGTHFDSYNKNIRENNHFANKGRYRILIFSQDRYFRYQWIFGYCTIF